MAKTSVAEWSTTRASNSDIDGINIAEGCPAGNMNDAVRELMAQVAETPLSGGTATHDTLTGLTYALTFTRSSDNAADVAAVFGWNDGGLALTGRTGIVFATGGSGDYTDTIERGRIKEDGSAAFQGTKTNDNAAVGYIGEYKDASVLIGAPAALTTTVASNLQNVSLEAGDWDVSCAIYYLPSSATVQQLQASLSVVSATLDNTPGRLATEQLGSMSMNGVIHTVMIPPTRFSLSSTTTVLCVGRAVFSAGTVSMFGTIRARRVR
jgi:hypothetical protein